MKPNKACLFFVGVTLLFISSVLADTSTTELKKHREGKVEVGPDQASCQNCRCEQKLFQCRHCCLSSQVAAGVGSQKQAEIDDHTIGRSGSGGGQGQGGKGGGLGRKGGASGSQGGKGGATGGGGQGGATGGHGGGGGGGHGGKEDIGVAVDDAKYHGGGWGGHGGGGLGGGYGGGGHGGGHGGGGHGGGGGA